MKEILLSIRDLSIGYKDKILFENVNLDIHKGDCILLCGANGSGKTTLLKRIAGMRNDISMIPSRIPKVPGFTLREFIGLALYNNSRLTALQEESISEAMLKINITPLADRDISTLSDGEFQKGCIAIALAKKSAVILLDEPTVFLDAENRMMVLQSLRNISDNSTISPAVIFSTHDLHEASTVCNKVIALGSDGVIRCETENISGTIATIFR